ncbi:MAG: AMIN domain-containing protein [Candidatus Binatia bacterium]|nr:AMIN domain-containing protein [Candidatus Binatia bacterium]
MKRPVAMRLSVVLCLVFLTASPIRAEAPRLSAISVKTERAETVVRLAIEDGQARPSVHMLADHRLIMDLPGVVPALPSHRLDAASGQLLRIRVGVHTEPETRTRVVFDLSGPTAYSVRFTATGLDVRLRAPGSEPAEAAAAESIPEPTETAVPTATPSPRATATPSPTAAPTASPSPSPAPTATPSPAPELATQGNAKPAAAVPASEPVSPGSVTIDFRKADVRTVIGLIANVGGYDVIFTPEVKGLITIQIIDGPWEEALDEVLEKKYLRATRHADLILVSPGRWD